LSIRFSDRLASTLASAQSVVAFTGAGISAESGVPTFRGAGGLWKKMRPEELASLEGFMKNPSLVWEWYTHRRTIIQTVRPNAGHEALVEMERIVPVFALVTQNIDNLHRRAGSVTVHELHGNIERNYCLQCGATYRGTEVPLTEGRPSCTRCGGLVRPDVVWFGEFLPEEAWEAAVRAAESADLFMSIGTSALVYPAASLPLTAKRRGAFLVEVNTESTPLTDRVDEFLVGSAATILPELVRLARRVRGVVG
jgi:NAD-dependent deacetylase